jgi:hypothetical protein
MSTGRPFRGRSVVASPGLSAGVTFLVVGVTCWLIGYLAADAWLTADRRWSPVDAGRRDRATLALAMAGVYAALHLLA